MSMDTRQAGRVGGPPSHLGGVDQPKGPEVGKMGGRAVTKSDARSLEVPKSSPQVVDAPKERSVVKGPEGGVGQLKQAAKLAGVPDRAGMIALAGRPKDDVTFLGLTVHKMSTGYKAVLDKLDDYHAAAALTGGGHNDAGAIDGALQTLNRLNDLADSYLSVDKHGRHENTMGLKHEIASEKECLTNLKTQLKGHEGGRLPEGMSLKDALAYARRGHGLDNAVKLHKAGVAPQNSPSPPPLPGSVKVDRPMSKQTLAAFELQGLDHREAQVLHNHGHGPEVGTLYKQLKIPINEKTVAKDLVDARRQGDAEQLGKGAFNTVWKAKYARTDGSTFTGVFKKEVNSARAVGGAGEQMGIDLSNPQLGCRNLAARATNDLLGWNVVPQVEFGVHHDELGIVMGLAPGETRWSHKKDEITGQEAHELRDLRQRAKADGMGIFQGMIDDAGRRLGGKIRFEGAQVFVERTVANDIDFTNPGVRKGLVQLQWLDGIDAQGDRHGGNYLVHVSDTGAATVTGIDNDQAEGHKIKDAGQCRYGYDDEHQSYRGCGWPPIADESMYRDVMSLKADDVRTAHEGLLTPGEIDSKVDRLLSAQRHMAKLKVQGKIIKDDQWDGPKATKALSTDDSYVGRDRR